MLRSFILSGVVILSTSMGAHAATVTINQIDATGIGAVLGTVILTDTRYGLMLEPDLSGLPTGYRGFHLHEKGSCAPGDKDGKPTAGMAAGGHYDPAHTGKHLGPGADGHKGDLPMLMVDKDGKATLPVLASHLKLADAQGKALMIHAGGDNFADEPAPLGGGGGRIACGVVK